MTLARLLGASWEDREDMDTLGQPPPIETYLLSGVEYDELADHDSLGRPPPIFGGTVETSRLATGEELSAATITELVTIAKGLTGAAEAAASLDLLRTTP